MKTVALLLLLAFAATANAESSHHKFHHKLPLGSYSDSHKPSHWHTFTWRSPATFYLQNRGDHEVRMLLEDEEHKVCGQIRLKPAAIGTYAACGNVLVWNDSARNRFTTVDAGNAYEIYWDGKGWDVRDVTADRQ